MFRKQHWVAAGFFCSAAVTLWLGAMIARAEAAPCPGECDADFLSSREYIGKIECEHGPEYDSDCGDPPDCCETAAGGCTGAANECNCYSCGEGTCEAEFRTWICGCGRTSSEGFEQPDPPEGECACETKDTDPDEILDEARDMTGSCDAGENFWMTWIFYCGGPSFAANCLAVDDSNCVYAEGSTWERQAPDGKRPKCKVGS